jgi:hypothetical protein
VKSRRKKRNKNIWGELISKLVIQVPTTKNIKHLILKLNFFLKKVNDNCKWTNATLSEPNLRLIIGNNR